MGIKITFGKYKNQELSLVHGDTNYKTWLLNQQFFKNEYSKEYQYLLNYKVPINFFKCLEENLDGECIQILSRYLNPCWNDYKVKNPNFNKEGAKWKLLEYVDRPMKHSSFVDQVYTPKPIMELKPIHEEAMSFNRHPAKLDNDRLVIAFKHRSNLLKIELKDYEACKELELDWLYHYVKGDGDFRDVISKNSFHRDMLETWKKYWVLSMRIHLLEQKETNHNNNGEEDAKINYKYFVDNIQPQLEIIGKKGRMPFGKYKNKPYQYIKNHMNGWYRDYLCNKLSDKKYTNDILDKIPSLKVYFDLWDLKSKIYHDKNHLYN